MFLPVFSLFSVVVGWFVFVSCIVGNYLQDFLPIICDVTRNVSGNFFCMDYVFFNISDCSLASSVQVRCFVFISSTFDNGFRYHARDCLLACFVTLSVGIYTMACLFTSCSISNWACCVGTDLLLLYVWFQSASACVRCCP